MKYLDYLIATIFFLGFCFLSGYLETRQQNMVYDLSLKCLAQGKRI